MFLLRELYLLITFVHFHLDSIDSVLSKVQAGKAKKVIKICTTIRYICLVETNLDTNLFYIFV